MDINYNVVVIMAVNVKESRAVAEGATKHFHTQPSPKVLCFYSSYISNVIIACTLQVVKNRSGVS
jgi:hypothetical protein